MASTAIVSSSQAATQTATGKTSSSALSTLLNLTPSKANTSTGSKPTRASGRGGWIHPRMDEVIRRRNATNFDSSNLNSILVSAAMILITFFIPIFLRRSLPLSALDTIRPLIFYLLWAIRLLFAMSIGVKTLPLMRTPDACEDVPLTPTQRQLLGLPPMSRPATPQEKEQYVTPPRFSRSNTPHSASSSLYAEASDSPLSGRGTPLDNSGFRMSASGSPFGSAYHTRTGSGDKSPLGALRSGGERRRLSYTGQKSSPLSESLFDSSSFGSGTGSTPTKGGNKASVGLNNKWLYEKGRGSPGMNLSRGPSFY